MTIGLYGSIREKFGFEQEIRDDATILVAIAFWTSIVALSLGITGFLLIVAAFALLFYLMISDFLGASYPLVSHTGISVFGTWASTTLLGLTIIVVGLILMLATEQIDKMIRR